MKHSWSTAVWGGRARWHWADLGCTQLPRAHAGSPTPPLISIQFLLIILYTFAYSHDNNTFAYSCIIYIYIYISDHHMIFPLIIYIYIWYYMIFPSNKFPFNYLAMSPILAMARTHVMPWSWPTARRLRPSAAPWTWAVATASPRRWRWAFHCARRPWRPRRRRWAARNEGFKWTWQDGRGDVGSNVNPGFC